MKRLEKLVYIIIVVLISLTLCSCELDFSGEPEVTEAITTATVEPEPEPIPYPVTVNNVMFEKAPEKVISLSPSLTEILCEMGYKDKLVGVSDYCDYPPTVTDLASFGTGVSPYYQAIVDSDAELVISNSEAAAKDIFALEEAGIKYLYIPAPQNLNQLRNIYIGFGLIFEGLFTGTEKGEYSFSVLSQVCNNTGIVRLGKFVYITENLGVATGDTLESDVLSCFGENIAAESVDYNYETAQLLDNQPDVIILNIKYSIADLQNDPIYSQLSAVAANRIIYIDNSYFERPSSRLIILIDRLLADFDTLSTDIIIG